MTQDTWGRAREKLVARVGRNNYTTWIEPLKLAAFAGGVARFEVPTTFFGNWVARNFAEHILSELKDVGAEVSRVEFAVTRDPEPKPEPKRPIITARPLTRPARPVDEELPGAPLDARFTFDSFVVGKPNDLAHAAARRVAEGGPVSFNPLFLYGGVGLGKTHLMHAIAHELTAGQPALRVLYLSAEQFMYRFVQALRERQIMDF